ncbi:hypothetical protein HYC85_017141 [Camellia sinensis]|uniref:FBD domain-containing protein n=1 Tax=Camellia sinensis TaxID=4442 RepID=A0A7J7H1R9_CAMSI|nr:hypothetical protein HYC85_017141 [Camellia sinensis]
MILPSILNKVQVTTLISFLALYHALRDLLDIFTSPRFYGKYSLVLTCGQSNDLGKLPVAYNHLKVIELYQVSFEDMKKILVVLHLIVNSHCLQQLQISGSSNTSTATKALDLDFWEKECPSDCTFSLLETVKMTDMSSVPHEMEFIKFLLRNSPMLETMSITTSVYVTDGRLHMWIELVRF